MIGYEDGRVKPVSNISRAEVATIFFRLLSPEIREKNLTVSNVFTDVNEEMGAIPRFPPWRNWAL